ncbi:MAG TPA: nitroreductase family protein [Candidatus Anoxymicrobiaceae bacterium]|jgi:nitroreductase
MDTYQAIITRRSVREFTGEPVSEAELDRLLEAARWAPSGLNNQPWRLMKVQDRSTIVEMSNMTKYRGVIAGASAVIAVFLDAEAMYDRSKDLMSAGAAIENMLLAVTDAGLGACWLGEILARRQDVEALLEVADDLELVAVVAIGRPSERERTGVRHPIEKIVLTPPER